MKQKIMMIIVSVVALISVVLVVLLILKPETIVTNKEKNTVENASTEEVASELESKKSFKEMDVDECYNTLIELGVEPLFEDKELVKTLADQVVDNPETFGNFSYTESMLIALEIRDAVLKYENIEDPIPDVIAIIRDSINKD